MVVVTLAGLFAGATFPLVLELLAETAYPVPEGTSVCMMIMMRVSRVCDLSVCRAMCRPTYTPHSQMYLRTPLPSFVRSPNPRPLDAGQHNVSHLPAGGDWFRGGRRLHVHLGSQRIPHQRGVGVHYRGSVDAGEVRQA